MYTKIKTQSIVTAVLIGAIALVGAPQFIYAHSGNTGESEVGTSGGEMMMRDIEDGLVGDEAHEEMEELMEKMMQGTLAELEIVRMTELMQDNQVVGNMMMGRMFAGQGLSNSTAGDMIGSNVGFGMHGDRASGFYAPWHMAFWWLFGLLSLGFLVLANIALYRRIKSNSK